MRRGGEGRGGKKFGVINDLEVSVKGVITVLSILRVYMCIMQYNKKGLQV